MCATCHTISEPKKPSRKKSNSEIKAEKEKAKKLVAAEQEAELSELKKIQQQMHLMLLNSEKIDPDLLCEQLGDYRIWHDPDAGRSPVCTCKGKFRRVKCLNPHCRCRFRPLCKAELFCSLECYLACDFLEYIGLLIYYKGDASKVRKNISRKVYKASVKGYFSQQRKNERRREQRAAKKLENSEPEKNEGTVVAKLTLDQIDKTLRTLFGKPIVPKTSDSGDYVQQCSHPGCRKVLAEDTVNGLPKRYCSEICRETLRTVRQRLWIAYQKDGCPVVGLLLSVLDFIAL